MSHEPGSSTWTLDLLNLFHSTFVDTLYHSPWFNMDFKLNKHLSKYSKILNIINQDYSIWALARVANASTVGFLPILS
jgi:hypothetical protein